MKRTKYVHVNNYVAAIDVELIDSEPTDDWGPYLSLDDAYLLDDVRELLKKGDVTQAAQKARVYTLTPVATNQ